MARGIFFIQDANPGEAAPTALPSVEKFTAATDSIASSAQNKGEALSNIKGLLSEDTINNLVSSIVRFGIRLGVAILVFILGKLIIRYIFRWVRRAMHRREADPSLVTFLLSLVKITLYFILIIIVIGILGVPTSSFLALFASAGVAIGLALSGTLQNFAGGVLILLLRPYKVGDFIEAQGYAGKVKEIQIFNTVINTLDNKTIIIPNGGLSTGTINNYSKERYRRVDWTVGVAYGTDFKHAQKVLLSIIEMDKRVEKSPKPMVAINDLGDSSVNLTVRAWVESKDYWDVYFDLNEKFYQALPENNIQFPFPQLDVHLNPND